MDDDEDTIHFINDSMTLTPENEGIWRNFATTYYNFRASLRDTVEVFQNFFEYFSNFLA